MIRGYTVNLPLFLTAHALGFNLSTVRTAQRITNQEFIRAELFGELTVFLFLFHYEILIAGALVS